MKRKKFAVLDGFGCVNYHLHGVAIRATNGLVELLDINTNGHPTDLYTKAIIALDGRESVVEVVNVSSEAPTETLG
jgi:hypothetical protein